MAFGKESIVTKRVAFGEVRDRLPVVLRVVVLAQDFGHPSLLVDIEQVIEKGDQAAWRFLGTIQSPWSGGRFQLCKLTDAVDLVRPDHDQQQQWGKCHQTNKPESQLVRDHVGRVTVL